ncbi:MAG: 1,4-dihydroxy-6-naphthoate synthase [Bacteroidetes bacterium]|jgi:1,4-dihydroxy-6-naphthoate synthase|nr:1,4-dihydroxy-6-naphthoate synthase [Bacteroidota bacterium]
MFTLAFSPCPNDTFIFDALVNKKIDTEGLEFDVVLEDVQTLNEWALQGKMDFTKISYGVLPLILENYKILNSGGALGKGVGPLLISHQELGIENWEQENQIAIPGENTTAHLLFTLAYPNATNKKFMVFNEIENYVLQNKNSLGVIIHENRFTYQQKGLNKVLDLGEYWEQTIKLPIPLGGIVAHKRVDIKIVKKVDRLIKKSLEYAFEHYPIITNYVKQHSQEMEEAVMKQHIDLYVNDFSLNLGIDGKAAVVRLLEVYKNIHPNTEIDFDNIFLN